MRHAKRAATASKSTKAGLAALGAAGLLGISACGGGVSDEFREIYTAQSSGEVSVERASQFGHDVCSALKAGTGDNLLRVLMPVAAKYVVKASWAEQQDLKVALKVGVSVYCPKQLSRYALNSGGFSI